MCLELNIEDVILMCNKTSQRKCERNVSDVGRSVQGSPTDAGGLKIGCVLGLPGFLPTMIT